MNTCTPDQIIKSLKKGAFTPFIGAGASGLRENAQPDEYHCMGLMRSYRNSTTYFRYGKLLSSGLAPSQIEYLKILINVDADKSMSLFELCKGMADKLYEGQLLKFQKMLLSVIINLTNTAGKRFADGSLISISEDNNYITMMPDEQKELVEPFVKLIKITEELSSVDETVCCENCKEGSKQKECLFVLRDHFRPKYITYRLKLLANFLLTAGQRKEIQSFKIKSDLIKSILEDRQKHNGCFFLSELEWLKQLLWHSIRFDDPQLPSTRELMFQMTIETIDGLPMIGELPQVAERTDVTGGQGSGYSEECSIKVIQRCFDYCNKKTKLNSPKFYQIMAALLNEQYKAVRDNKYPEIVSGMHSLTVNGRKPIIAFTTNYDNNLENALCNLGCNYHVVYPVRRLQNVQENLKKEETDISWHVATFHIDNNDAVSQGDPEIIDQEDLIGAFIDRDLIGPIIVKLHGAPFMPLRDNLFKHFVLLSESNYLTSLVSNNALDVPQIFLKKARFYNQNIECKHHLWFFGYSISDWNIRIALYKQLRDRKRNEEHRRAITHGSNYYKIALFSKLDIDYEEKELSESMEDISVMLGEAFK